jgi:hypothetical protein
VAEQLYPLKFGEQIVDAEDIAAELMSLPAGDADMRATVYMKRWGFPNTYTLGKHLTEHLVAKYQVRAVCVVGVVWVWVGRRIFCVPLGPIISPSPHPTNPQARLQLPVALVRPSLVSAIAGMPYPGYSGNYAGCIGAGAAMAIGLFDCLGSVASRPMGVWDIVPADLVGSAIIAAAAALAAGASSSISRATGSGALHNGARATRYAAARCGGVELVTASSGSLDFAHNLLRATGGGGGAAVPAKRDLASFTDSDTATSGSGSASDGEAGSDASPQAVAAAHPLTARLLEHAAARESGSGERAGGRPLLIVHAATSSTYPLTLMEGWNYNLEFFAAHPPPFSITPGSLPRMTDAFVPNDAKVMACRAWTRWKVWVICSLLK